MSECGPDLLYCGAEANEVLRRALHCVSNCGVHALPVHLLDQPKALARQRPAVKRLARLQTRGVVRRCLPRRSGVCAVGACDAREQERWTYIVPASLG